VGARTSELGENPRELLLAQCQALAIRQQAPFYGVNTVFSRCWIPSVPNINSPPSALNAYPNFEYEKDINNPDAYQFWVAPTSSVPR
jgi:hypothetical protein